jgi:hypothetical protein
MQPVIDFLNNPVVVPIYGVLVLALADFLLGVYRTIQGGVFDWQKLPQVLDSVVLQKVVPLFVLGVAAWMVTDGAAKTALQAAYVALAAAVLAAEVQALIAKVTGSYKPSNVAMDRE